VDGHALAHLAPLPALGALVLDQCGLVGDAHLPALARLTSLTRLSLAGCRGVTGRPAAATGGPGACAPRGLVPLARLPALRELSLAGLERLRDDALAGLAAAPALAALHLDLCPLLTCAAEPPPRRYFLAVIDEGNMSSDATPGCLFIALRAAVSMLAIAEFCAVHWSALSEWGLVLSSAALRLLRCPCAASAEHALPCDSLKILAL